MPWLNKPKRKKESEQRKISNQERQKVYNTKRWQKLRTAYYQAHPLCELCLQQGITKVGEDVHHLFSPFIFGVKYAFDPYNLITLCKQCHGLLHAEHRESSLYYIYYKRKNENRDIISG